MSFKIEVTWNFEVQIKKLTKSEQKSAYRKIQLLIENPFHPSLRTKKIQGFEGLFECSINMDIRIIWQYKAGTIILLLDIGHHDIL